MIELIYMKIKALNFSKLWDQGIQVYVIPVLGNFLLELTLSQTKSYALSVLNYTSKSILNCQLALFNATLDNLQTIGLDRAHVSRTRLVCKNVLL